MKIGAVAEALGISTSALRYYERIGLLRGLGSARGENNYRSYNAQDLDHLRMVLALKQSGLRLEDIGQLMKSSQKDCGPLLRAVEQQLISIQESIAVLNARKQSLSELMATCRSTCSATSGYVCLKC